MSDRPDEPGGAKVIPIEAALPHFAAELICIACRYRYVCVWPHKTPLSALECPRCGELGTIILTGQPDVGPDE